MTFSRKVKDVFADPLYQNVFSTRLNPNFQGNEEWAIENDTGGYVAAGVGGGITGRGAHVLVIDDPIKNAEEADSPDVREKLYDWYISTAYTRLAPGGGVLVIQTWWHDDDLAGRLQTIMAQDDDADQFEVIKYPAIAEFDEYRDLVTDELVRVNPDDDVTTQPNFAMLDSVRKKGEALHPERYDIGKLMRIKKALNSGRFWSALYQQNPVPDDGAYFTKSQFKRQALPMKERCNVFIAWDFAISIKKQNDYTVGVVGLHDSIDMLHIADLVRFKSKDSFFIVESILGLSERWKTRSQVWGFEDGQIWRTIEALLKKRMRERKIYVPIVVLPPITDKMARARPLQGRMEQGMVSFSDTGDWYDAAKAELLRFPAGVHDDQVDALAWLTQMVIGAAAPRPTQGKPLKSWKDKLTGIGVGSVSHMAA